MQSVIVHTAMSKRTATLQWLRAGTYCWLCRVSALGGGAAGNGNGWCCSWSGSASTAAHGASVLSPQTYDLHTEQGNPVTSNCTQCNATQSLLTTKCKATQLLLTAQNAMQPSHFWLHTVQCNPVTSKCKQHKHKQVRYSNSENNHVRHYLQTL